MRSFICLLLSPSELTGHLEFFFGPFSVPHAATASVRTARDDEGAIQMRPSPEDLLEQAHRLVGIRRRFAIVVLAKQRLGLLDLLPGCRPGLEETSIDDDVG